MYNISNFQTFERDAAHWTKSKIDLPSDAAKILFVIPRGEVIRNFVFSGTLDRLAEHCDVDLLTVEPNSSMTEMLSRKFGHVYPLREINERWAVRFQREIIEMAHGKWLWSRAAQQRWRLRDSEAVSFRQKAIRAAKKIISRPFSNRTGLRILSKTERLSSRVLRTTDEYIKLLNEVKPDLVFNGSHVHSRNAIQAVQAANWLGIPTATFVFSWDNLTSQGRITLPYDLYLVWSEDLKCQLLEIYDHVRDDQIVVTGSPQFDFHFRKSFYTERSEFCESIGADPDRPIVLYTTGMANHMPGEEEIVEEIADMLSDISTETKPQLLVRVYAKDLTGRFDELKNRRKDILFPEVAWEKEWLTPRFEDCAALVNTLRHCDVGVNIASTVSLELCMFDKPVINVAYNPRNLPEENLDFAEYYKFDHYSPIIKSGAVELAEDRSAMRSMLCDALNDPRRSSSERKRLIKKMFANTLDGRSAFRVADALLDFIKTGTNG